MKTSKATQADCLDLMRSMDSKYIDLIYCDPPYNSGRDYGEFNDKYKSIDSYLSFLKPRLLEFHRILKDSGSIYLHCDWHASHYIKVEMDKIFGYDNFRNEIVWCYPPAGKAPKFGFPKKHDSILFYNNKNSCWHQPYTEMTKATRKTYSATENGRLYSKNHGKKTYLDTLKGRAVPSWWIDIFGRGTATNSKEWTAYPTQKPEALLERIIKASSNPGDVVFDPMCGSGTTLVVAKKLGRDYLGCDISEEAIRITEKRLQSLQLAM